MENHAIRLSHPTKSIRGTVELTGSKSESNRALIIQAWGGGLVEVANLSSAADTETLKQVLRDDVQHLVQRFRVGGR